MIGELRQFEGDNGRAPTSRDMRIAHGLHSYHSYRRAFGTWNKALKAAGIKFNKHRFSEAEAISKERVEYVIQQLKISSDNSEFIKDLKKAYLVGAIMGDGCVNYYCYGHKRQHYLIQFGNTSKLFVDEVMESMRCLGIKPRFIKRENHRFNDSCTRKPIYQVQGNNKEFVMWVKNTSIESINKWLISDVRLATAFLKGFYEAEGCFSRGYVEFVNTNEKLICLTQSLIRYLGVNTHPPSKCILPSGKTKYTLRIKVGASVLVNIINPCIKRG